MGVPSGSVQQAGRNVDEAEAIGWTRSGGHQCIFRLVLLENAESLLLQKVLGNTTIQRAGKSSKKPVKVMEHKESDGTTAFSPPLHPQPRT